MFMDRRGLKREARLAMGAARPSALYITLLYLLLTAGLSLAVRLLVENPLEEILSLYQQGVALERAIPLALVGVGSLGLFLNILMAICGVVVDFGYCSWSLKAARGEPTGAGELLAGFSMVGRIMWLRILVLIYSLLWYLAILMPATVGVTVSLFVPGVGTVAAIGLGAVAIVAYISRILRYTMATCCLVDEPEKGASWALYRSRQIMTGRVKSYFVLMLSFLGWHLLGGLLVSVIEGLAIAVMGGVHLLIGRDPGVLQTISSSTAMTVVLTLASWPVDVWLTPYIALSKCKFYDRIENAETPAI